MLNCPQNVPKLSPNLAFYGIGIKGKCQGRLEYTGREMLKFSRFNISRWNRVAFKDSYLFYCISVHFGDNLKFPIHSFIWQFPIPTVSHTATIRGLGIGPTSGKTIPWSQRFSFTETREKEAARETPGCGQCESHYHATTDNNTPVSYKSHKPML